MLSEDQVERVLVVAAHPDDADFGVAGTTAWLTDSGIEVGYCIVTDGDAGGFDPSVPRSDIPRIRREEQRAAGKVVGVSNIEFLGYPDGGLVVSLDLRRDLARSIRRFRPQRVICPSPERNLSRIQASHPDHLATGEAALSAVYPDSRNPFAFPELLEQGFEPHTVGEVWLMAHPSADRFVDITDSLDRKISALLCHESQITEPDALEARIREWTAATAKAGGLPEGRFAEGFRVVETA